MLYTSLDPSTAILEVAVHKGFDTLDRVPHRLLEIGLPLKANQAYVLHPADVPNPNWLYPGVPSSNQQAFGDNLLAHHGLVIVPSVVSRHSWNCLISVAAFPDLANTLRSEERCGLDTRLIQLR